MHMIKYCEEIKLPLWLFFYGGTERGDVVVFSLPHKGIEKWKAY